MASMKHGARRDIDTCTCTLQSGFNKSLVRVIRPMKSGDVAPASANPREEPVLQRDKVSIEEEVQEQVSRKSGKDDDTAVRVLQRACDDRLKSFR